MGHVTFWKLIVLPWELEEVRVLATGLTEDGRGADDEQGPNKPGNLTLRA